MDADRLAMLLTDYGAAREDLRNLEQSRATVLGLALTSLTVMGVVVSGDRRVQEVLDLPSGTARIPDLLLAATPLIPVSLVAYLIIVGTGLVLKIEYCRRIERELALSYRQGDQTPFTPMWAEIEVAASRVSGAKVSLLGPVLVTLVVSAALLFGGFTLVVARVVDTPWQIGMGVFYGGAGMLLLHRATVMLWAGRTTYLELEQVSRAQVQLKLLARRGLPTWFWVFPRSGPDSLVKTAIPLLSGAVIFILYARPEPQVGMGQTIRFLLLIAIFELGLYQARYLLNDFRGLDQDKLHPGEHDRRRLSSFFPTQESAISFVLANVAGRVLISACLLVVFFPKSVVETMGWITAAFIVTSLIYDNVRDMRPISSRGETWASFLIHLIIGVGYSLRFLVGALGAALLMGLSLPEHVILGSAGFLYVYGLFCVSLTFALDAVAHVDADISARRRSPPGIAVASSLWEKPHLSTHIRYLGIVPGATSEAEVGPSRDATSIMGFKAKFMRAGDGICWWRIVPSVAATCYSLSWLLIVLGIPIAWLIVSTIVAISVVFASMAGPISRGVALVVVTAAAIVLAVLAPVGLAVATTAVVPWLAVMCITALFRAQSREDQLRGHEPLVRWLGVATASAKDMILRSIFGMRFARSLRKK